MSTASKVAQHKAKHPELYCLAPRCLWRTDERYCPRHKPKPIAPYKAQAQRIANVYNQLAEAERRKDLEEDNA
jgi:hypothetical protein